MLRRLKRKMTQQKPLTNTIFDITAWLSDNKHATAGITRGSALLYCDYEHSGCDAFFELLFEMYQNGLIPLVSSFTNSTPIRKLNAIYEDGEDVWIPKVPVNTALAKRYLPVLDINAISRVLSDAGELIKEDIFKEQLCWCIPYKTWRTKIGALAMRRKYNKVRV
jgi:hypothetical protein